MPPQPHNPAQFTLDGSAELERQLAALCEQVRLGILPLVGEQRLEGLVLGGGYGRGQGGVLKNAGGDAPYNDLEFYVFLKGNHVWNTALYRNRCTEFGDSLSPKVGLHVEFKVDSLEKLRHSPVTIFSYDLVSGHRVIDGAPNVFVGCEHHLDARRIVASEATRLLLNRGSGLLLAKELLLHKQLNAEQCDFIGRNLAKVELAIGDALLAAQGLYHWDCRERHGRLAEICPRANWPDAEEILAHHAAGVEFKLHPRRMVKSRADFAREHRRLTELTLQTWLWIENHRLKANFANLEEYSLSTLDKCGTGSAWRNFLLNFRTFGPSATFDRRAPRYPRERLLNALPLLLREELAAASPSTTRHLQKQLHTRAADWQGLVAAYKHVWSCCG